MVQNSKLDFGEKVRGGGEILGEVLLWTLQDEEGKK